VIILFRDRIMVAVGCEVRAQVMRCEYEVFPSRDVRGNIHPMVWILVVAGASGG
jgi:hypothetical protein